MTPKQLFETISKDPNKITVSSGTICGYSPYGLIVACNSSKSLNMWNTLLPDDKIFTCQDNEFGYIYAPLSLSTLYNLLVTEEKKYISNADEAKGIVSEYSKQADRLWEDWNKEVAPEAIDDILDIVSDISEIGGDSLDIPWSWNNNDQRKGRINLTKAELTHLKNLGFKVNENHRSSCFLSIQWKEETKVEEPKETLDTSDIDEPYQITPPTTIWDKIKNIWR